MNRLLTDRTDQEELAVIVTRYAVGLAFLSAVADRFGFCGPVGTKNVSWGNWGNFVSYTGQLTSVFPHTVTIYCAWLATLAEIVLGLFLILGLRVKWKAILSACLLAAFGLSMAVALGVKAPLNYSVFSAAAASWLLSFREADRFTLDFLMSKSLQRPGRAAE